MEMSAAGFPAGSVGGDAARVEPGAIRAGTFGSAFKQHSASTVEGHRDILRL